MSVKGCQLPDIFLSWERCARKDLTFHQTKPAIITAISPPTIPAIGPTPRGCDVEPWPLEPETPVALATAALAIAALERIVAAAALYTQLVAVPVVTVVETTRKAVNCIVIVGRDIEARIPAEAERAMYASQAGSH